MAIPNSAFIAVIETVPGRDVKQIAQALKMKENTCGVRLSAIFQSGKVKREMISDGKTRNKAFYYPLDHEKGEVYNPTTAIPRNKKAAPQAEEALPQEQHKTVATIPPEVLTSLGPFKHVLEDYIEAISDMITESIVERVRVKLPIALEDTLEEVPQVQEKRKRLPRVLIVGLLPDQANVIQGEFSQTFDLRFTKPKGGTQTLKEKARRADMTFIMTSWISHSVTGEIKSVTDKTRYVSGHLEALRQELTAYFVDLEEGE